MEQLRNVQSLPGTYLSLNVGARVLQRVYGCDNAVERQGAPGPRAAVPSRGGPEASPDGHGGVQRMPVEVAA